MIKPKMGKNDFYSVKLKKRIKIADGKIRKVVRSGRRFHVGKYSVEGKEYEAWKIVGKA